MSTKIEWTNETWNPIIGCQKCSPGCNHCYAERMAVRLAGNPKTSMDYSPVITNGHWNGTTMLRTEVLKKPFSWKTPRMIFVVSMGDLFHESVPFSWVDKVMTIIACNPQHTFQVLTKRPEIMKRWFDWQRPGWEDPGMRGPEAIRYYCWHNHGKKIKYGGFWPLKNLWLGVTCENQEQTDKRIPILLQIPAEKRFVSIEPMIGPISFRWAKWHPIKNTWHLDGLKQLDWVIVGGETGPGARPMHPAWVTQIREQCQESNTPFFFKSWGEWIPVTYVNGDRSYLNVTIGKNEFLFMDPPINMIKSRRFQDYKHKLEGKEWRGMP
ncbi:hypothetical protein ES707_11016 [subsurface metagenome]